MRNKLFPWKIKFLTPIARETLAKSVLMKFWTTLCNTFKSQRKPLSPFIKSSLIEKRKMHYVSWEKITQPNVNGGLGLVDAHTKNLSLIDGLSWKFFSNCYSFWACTLTNKYNNHHIKCSPSFCMKHYS